MRSKWAMIAGALVVALVIVHIGDTGAQTGKGRTRQDIYKEMEATLGLAPTFMKMVPDNSLELEWELMKQVQELSERIARLEAKTDDPGS